MNDLWSTCPSCGLKFRSRPEGCPRCARQASAAGAGDGEALPTTWPDGTARITEYSVGEAAEGPAPFRLPWFLLAGTLVVALLGALVAPVRLGVGMLLIGSGAFVSIAAGIWTLMVCYRLGVGWLIGALFIHLVGLVALFRAGNLRPLALNVTAVVMLGVGFGLVSAAQPPRAARGADGPDGVAEAEVRDLTREEYLAECRSQNRDVMVCGCTAAALYDELGSELRVRYLNERATPEDKAAVAAAITRNCRRR